MSTIQTEQETNNTTTCQMDGYIPPNNTSITIINELVPALNVTESYVQMAETFEPISLAEMDSVKLMNRIDTKFLIGASQLHELLRLAQNQYRIVEIQGKRIIPYSTIYFDTDSSLMYMMHHNRKLNRFKIRMRSYIDSGITFLEIKWKNNKGRTSKKRIEIPAERFEKMVMEEKEQLFVTAKTPFEPLSLVPQIQNYFRRITLVDKSLTERVTLDVGLTYKKLSNGEIKTMDGLVIVEMKQDGAYKSHFRDYLNELCIYPGSISKYCLGMILVNPLLKKNRFKNKLRIINKITEKNHGTN
jgi:hypothetical protein